MPLSDPPSYAYSIPSVETLPHVTSQGLGKALPIGRDLKIDFTTHDLIVTSGDLVMVKDVQAIAQEVDIRLQFLLREWFLDVTIGVPFLQVIIVKAPNLAAVRTVLRDEILRCVGIKSITKLDLDFDRSTRKLTVTWSATTDLGELIPDREVTI